MLELDVYIHMHWTVHGNTARLNFIVWKVQEKLDSTVQYIMQGCAMLELIISSLKYPWDIFRNTVSSGMQMTQRYVNDNNKIYIIGWTFPL